MNSSEGQGQDPDSHSQTQQQNNSRDLHQTQGQQDNHDEMVNKKYSTSSAIRSFGAQEERDDASMKGSYKSEQHYSKQSNPPNEKQAGKPSSDYKHSEYSEDHNHVHFRDRNSMPHGGNRSLPPLPPGVKARSQSSEPPREDLARASWTTASFTELPGALDELTEQHHPSKLAPKEHDHYLHHHNKGAHSISAEQEKKPPSYVERKSSASDLQSILIKQGKHRGSILTKYLRPTMNDEGTQAGIPSWDWLSRLEQMLIHFFLMVFESSNDSSKLIMEMMSTEAGLQVEEIFQLLLKAEPDMYKELGHLVTLAEKWLIHWRGDSEERLKALEYVRLYMQGVRDRNYYTLPVQVRLHKLGAFIAGLKVMGRDASNKFPPIQFPSYKARPVPEVNQFRLNSPRVKPATHFSQVVANILCGRPCDDPLPKADVYADKLGINVFKNTLHGDKEFKTYTDKKYGRLYQKRELFIRDNQRIEIELDGGGDAQSKPLEHPDCVQNVHCWIPKYTKGYVQTLEDNGCEVLAKADFEKSVKVKECRLGKGADDKTCKDIKIIKPKKLYDWVRGPDGKVHRRVVGSYTELGTAASMSRLTGTSDAGGRNGRKPYGQHDVGFRFGKKGAGGMRDGGGRGGGMRGGGMRAGGMRTGGGQLRAVSDTRLGKRSYETKISQTIRSSKGRSTNTSKEKAARDDKLKKLKNNMTSTTLHVHDVDGMSIEGSGDSGQEDERIRKELHKKGGHLDGKHAKKGISSSNVRQTLKSGKGESSKFGSSNYGPTNKQHAQANNSTNKGGGRDNRNHDRENRGHDRSSKAYGRDSRFTGHDNRGTHGSGEPRGVGDDSKDKGIVNIYKSGRKLGARQNRKTPKSKRSRFSIDDEWGGEDYWSPGGSDYSYYDKDENYKQSNLQLLSLNQCWEKASKLFKKPSKALVIPPAENLMLYLEKKYPRSKWSRGNPIATRNYPNGTTFVAQYGNGSSKVFYPHGGLAVAISAPSPVTSQVLVVRDPSDHVFFFDKALLAEINSAGNGTIYGDDGIIKAQYSAMGGFKVDNLEKGRRWHWNHGGQRMLMKLNKFMSLRISDHDKIFLNFFGNHRGFLVNVASGQEVTLVNISSHSTRVDPIMHELKNLVRPKTKDDNFDYIRGRFNPRPTLGFVDKAKHYISANDMGIPEAAKFQGDSTPDAYFVKLMSRTLSQNNDIAGNFLSCTNVYRDNNAYHICALPVCCAYNTENNSNYYYCNTDQN